MGLWAWLPWRDNEGHWVNPVDHEIVKFMPHNPPHKGERVLVDGVRHEVVKSEVRWEEGFVWHLDRLKVRPL